MAKKIAVNLKAAESFAMDHCRTMGVFGGVNELRNLALCNMWCCVAGACYFPVYLLVLIQTHNNFNKFMQLDHFQGKIAKYVSGQQGFH